MAQDNRKPSPIEAQKYLTDMDYPADKQDLLEHAKENNADEKVMYFLERIPDRTYDGPNGVSQEIGRLDRADPNYSGDSDQRG
jgi:hypothetical protein